MSKHLVTTALALVLAVSTGSVGRASAYGPPPATSVIVITSKTHSVQVSAGVPYTFVIGGKKFIKAFGGGRASLDLRSVAPQGLLTHPVRVLVVPNPTQHEQGIP